MGKVTIISPEKVQPGQDVPRFRGATRTDVYYGRDSDPLHLHAHYIEPGDRFHVEPGATDCLLYVWQGSVVSGGRTLDKGSTLIVERGAAIEVSGGEISAVLLNFAAASPPAHPRAGGNVHLLPQAHVPRIEAFGEAHGIGGAIFADGTCPTCELWLHENIFPGRPDAGEGDGELGVHSHTEDEIIFVTGGEIQLGSRRYGPGTAIAIGANTFYGFAVGPKGLNFVNFRAATPGDILFNNGQKPVDEALYWRSKLGSPVYLAPA